MAKVSGQPILNANTVASLKFWWRTFSTLRCSGVRTWSCRAFGLAVALMEDPFRVWTSTKGLW